MGERHPPRDGELTVDRLLGRLAALEQEHARLQREYARLGAQLRTALERRPGPPGVAPRPGRDAAPPRGQPPPSPAVEALGDEASPGVG